MAMNESSIKYSVATTILQPLMFIIILFSSYAAAFALPLSFPYLLKTSSKCLLRVTSRYRKENADEKGWWRSGAFVMPNHNPIIVMPISPSIYTKSK